MALWGYCAFIPTITEQAGKVGVCVGPYPCVRFLFDSRGRLHALLQQTHTAGWAEMSHGHEQ